jgi:hypothetical protein
MLSELGRSLVLSFVDGAFKVDFVCTKQPFWPGDGVVIYEPLCGDVSYNVHQWVAVVCVHLVHHYLLCFPDTYSL